MSDAAIVDLDRLFGQRTGSGIRDGDLRVEGHLPECQRTDRPAVDCDWCLWAVSTAGLRRAADLVLDARELRAEEERRHGDVSVAWVVAAGDVVDDVEEMGRRGRADVIVPSVSELTERVHRLALDEVAPLRSRIDVAVGAGGPVEQRCLLSAGLLAAGALRRPEHLERCAAMSPAVRSTFEDVAALVSAEVQQAGVVPLLEQIHWDGLPTLRTQPAWRRRPSRASAATVGSRQAAGAGLEPGSLEALVMEATLDVVAERLTGILPALLASEAPVLRRSSGRIRRSASTRALTMRMGRIDWAATFADSGRSRCWHAVDGGVMLPWAVAVGIDEGERLGLLSATHSDPPDAGWWRA